MPRCGCASDTCTCHVIGGANVEVDGSGSLESPYVISAEATAIEVQDTSTINMNISGGGADGNPYVISADSLVTGGGGGTPTPVPPPTRQIFTASGDWTKQPGCSYVQISVTGGGGGGGGCQAATSGNRTASGGGGAGGTTTGLIAVADLLDIEPITVGAGGTAGNAGPNKGGNGEHSLFGTHAEGRGGIGGEGGVASAGLDARTIGGAGGTAAGGDLRQTGGHGSPSKLVGGQVGSYGEGGDSAVGVGGVIDNLPQHGGGGAGTSTSGTAAPGQAGAKGVVIVTTYYGGP